MPYLVLFFAFICSAIHSPAQAIRLGTDSGYVSAQVTDAPLKRMRADREYHWVRSQNMMVTRGGVGGAVLDGSFSAFHPNGQLREQGEFRRGLKHGEWRTWDRTGRSMVSAQWHKGLRHGLEIHYAADGSIAGRSHYKKGVQRTPSETRGGIWKKKDAGDGPAKRTAAKKKSPRRNVDTEKEKKSKERKPRSVRNAKSPKS